MTVLLDWLAANTFTAPSTPTDGGAQDLEGERPQRAAQSPQSIPLSSPPRACQERRRTGSDPRDGACTDQIFSACRFVPCCDRVLGCSTVFPPSVAGTVATCQVSPIATCGASSVQLLRRQANYRVGLTCPPPAVPL